MEPKKTVIKITEPDRGSGEFLQVLKFEFPGTPYPTEYWLQKAADLGGDLLTVLHSFRLTESEAVLFIQKVEVQL